VALALLAPSAHGLGLGIGTPPGGLSPFRPGATAQASGTLTVTGALTNWTLQITDGTAGTTNPGHLKRSVLCSFGVTYLSNPLSITVSPLVGSASSSGPQSLSATPTTVATGAATAATTVTAAFSQDISTNEVLEQGCVYGATVTFTLT
jgi:hypothetical protein